MNAQPPETHGTPPGGNASLTAERDVSVSGLSFADDAATEGAATLTDLQGQRCPNCTSGVLYVTRYDPEALHEEGQQRDKVEFDASGGAYEVNCFSCHFHESRILPTVTEEQRQEEADRIRSEQEQRRGWR